MTDRTIFTDFLGELGVPYTPAYSNRRFRTTSFKSVYGLRKLLAQYGVDSEGLRLADKSELSRLTPPFIAQTSSGLVIVTDMKDGQIGYLTQSVGERIPADEFRRAWNGVVFCAYPRPEACEPDYKAHRLAEFMVRFRNWGLLAGTLLLFLYLFISNGIYSHVSTVLVTLLDIAGLVFTVMLVQKSLNIHTRAADNVCKVLQEGGCDHVLETKASKAFGIFGWSEVGLTYFSVSLLCLLMFPAQTGYLALCNLCCLPFSFWSIWYQKFRARAWCTLCVSVQATLWLLFFCYLGGGFLRDLFPLRLEFFILGLTYFTVLMGLNRLLPHFSRPD